MAVKFYVRFRTSLPQQIVDFLICLLTIGYVCRCMQLRWRSMAINYNFGFSLFYFTIHFFL